MSSYAISACVLNGFFILTYTLFVLKRGDRMIRERGVGLVCLGSLLSALQTNHVLLLLNEPSHEAALKNIPCFLLLWMDYLCGATVPFICLVRSAQLVYLYRLNKQRMVQMTPRRLPAGAEGVQAGASDTAARRRAQAGSCWEKPVEWLLQFAMKFEATQHDAMMEAGLGGGLLIHQPNGPTSRRGSVQVPVGTGQVAVPALAVPALAVPALAVPALAVPALAVPALAVPALDAPPPSHDGPAHADTSSSHGQPWHMRLRHWFFASPERVALTFFMGSMTLAAMIVQALSAQVFIIWRAELRDDQYYGNCLKPIDLVPYAGYMLLYLLLSPYFGFIIRQVKEGFHLKTELKLAFVGIGTWCCISATLICFPSLEAPASLGMGRHVFYVILGVWLQLVTIVYPIICSWRTAFQLRRISSSKDAFERVLKDPKLFAAFKLTSAKEFTVENPMFYECYEELMDRYQRLQSTMTPTPDARHTFRFSSTHATVGDTDTPSPKAPVPAEIKAKVCFMFDVFLKPGGPNELNVPAKYVRQVLDLIEREHYYHPDVFEDVMQEVLDMMYLNTFPKFLLEQKGPS